MDRLLKQWLPAMFAGMVGLASSGVSEAKTLQFPA